MPIRKVTLRIDDGRSVDMEVPPPAANFDSVFTFAIHKSGSVLLDNVIQDLCGFAKIPALSLPFHAFTNGLPEYLITSDSVSELVNSDGYCFYGFRGVLTMLDSVDLAKKRKVTLVRDPRDALTSYYFSMAKSHEIPPSGETRDRMIESRQIANQTSIDDFVLSPQVSFITDNFRKLMKIEAPTTKLFRYEDIIFDKEPWVKAVAEWLRLDVRDENIASIARRHDIRPADENPDRHVRQVTPGNYRKHLAPSTIEILNAQCQDILSHYNYAA